MHDGKPEPDVVEKLDAVTQQQPQIDAESAPEWSVTKALKDFSIKERTSPPDSPIPFMHLLERLKLTKREGWKRFGVDGGESISDHMYRMSIITMLAPPALKAKLDIPRCTQMAVVHDMAESLVGDITPQDEVPKVEKNRRESTTMQYLTQKLLGSAHAGLDAAGRDIMALWQEYEDSETLESKFVHDVDKLELLLQMNEYEGRDGKDLGEFCYVAQKIELPEVRAWALELLKDRKEFWGDGFAQVQGHAEVLDFIKTSEQ